MTVEIYLKSGQTITLTKVNDFEVTRNNTGKIAGYEFNLEPGFKRKPFYLDIDYIAALVRMGD